MNTVQAAGMMVEVTDGLTKEEIVALLEKIPDGEQFVPFEVSENNSAIIGFMTTECAEIHLEKITELATKLCNDWDNERIDKMYPIAAGVDFYVDCGVETLKDEKDLPEFTSWGNYVTVKTEPNTYEQVLLCPKPYTPAIHLLEAVNGDVYEVKTVDIISINGQTV
ncbi:hypothetical protein ACFVS2_25170 [Brevibacillus sp. NPDC058079]|uniref:hypothetical protein n=1 Tax=Brevibacillus sp. NPDC058079 TaxID=3346330 RepID=UPI0036EB6765